MENLSFKEKTMNPEFFGKSTGNSMDHWIVFSGKILTGNHGFYQ